MNLGKQIPHTKPAALPKAQPVTRPEIRIVSLPRPSEKAQRRRQRDGVKQDGIPAPFWPRRVKVPAEVTK